MKLLVTGFKDFMGIDNPTKKIAKALDGHNFNGIEIKGIEIPVSWEKSWEVVNQHLEEFKPDALVSFGVNTGIRGMAIETKAYNTQSRIPDADGKYPRHNYIQQDGPYALPTCLPANYLYQAVNHFKGTETSILRDRPEGELIGMSLSNNAGDYLCNNIFYNDIYHQKSKLFIKGFIHIQGEDYYSSLNDLIQSSAFTIDVLTKWMSQNTLHTSQQLIN